MYQPGHFREDRIAVLHGLIRDRPLALLVTAGPGGLMANAVPFLLDANQGAQHTLRAHLARANPQTAELANGTPCLVVFQGPQAYVSPSWYPSKQDGGKVVPTWNYVMVQVRGRPRLVDDAAWLRRQIDDLTQAMEAPRTEPWQVGDAPDSYIQAMIRGIVGVEIPVDAIDGKWKASQNRVAADRAGVAAGLRVETGSADPMAALIDALGP